MVDLTKIRQNLRVFWKLMNPPECVWENSIPSNHEDHIAGKSENSLQHYNLVSQVYSYASSYENSGSESSGGQGMGKNWRKFWRGNLAKVKSKRKVIDEARMSGATVHFASLMDICPSEKMLNWRQKHQKYKGSSCAPR